MKNKDIEHTQALDAYYKDMVHAVTGGFVAFDGEWRCLYSNDFAKHVLDLARNNPVGKNFSRQKKFISSVFYTRCIEAIRSKQSVSYQQYSEHRDRCYSITIYPTESVITAYISDNTHQIKRLNELEEDHKRHRMLIESVKDYAIFLIDVKGKVTTWNKGAEQLLGYTSGEIIGKSRSLFYTHEDRRKGVDKKQFAHVKKYGSLEDERWWVKKDGGKIWANDVLTIYRDEQGIVKGYTKVVRDMTERKNTEEVVRRYTEDLERTTRAVETEVAKDEALLDSIGEGVIATNENGRIVVFNKQAQALLGWNEDDALGEFYHDVWKTETENGDPVPLGDRPLIRALKTGKKVIENSYYYSSRYRKRFPVAVTAAPVLLEGRTIGVVIVFRDIRKEKEVDRAKSEFVSLASHQLRTPLTAIKLFVEMLGGGDGVGPLTEQQAELLRSIDESNEKMIKLVENLLNVSRLETGVLNIKLEQVYLSDFVNDILKEVSSVALIRGCVVAIDSSRAIDTKITTDPVLLRQVVSNIVNNAISYSNEEQGRVRVTLEVEQKKQYRIIVEDNGIGVPKEDMANIFQKFYRAPNAMRARTVGNGLGLYMCKMITEALGGRIFCVSNPAGGTIFTISFPLNKLRIKHTKGKVEKNKK